MFLGIDLGTSEVKLLLMAEDGSIVGSAGEAFQRLAAAAAVERATPRPTGGPPPRRPPACAPSTRSPGRHPRIGLSGQMHGAVTLDGDLQPIRPPSSGTTAAAPPSATSS